MKNLAEFITKFCDFCDYACSSGDRYAYFEDIRPMLKDIFGSFNENIISNEKDKAFKVEITSNKFKGKLVIYEGRDPRDGITYRLKCDYIE